MASTRQSRKGKQASEDSIDAEYGGDYSETTIDILKGFGRPGAKFGNLDSEEKAALQPPSQAICDAAIEGLKEYERSLNELAKHIPDQREAEWVDYKRALVEAASPEELTWLKLKAYHRGIDALRAARGEDAAGGDATPLGDAEAPSADGRVAEQPAACCSYNTNSTFPERDAVLRAVRELLPSSSSEEDTEATGVSGRVQRLASHASAGPAMAPPVLGGSMQAPAAQRAVEAVATLEDFPADMIYNASYLEEQTLSRRVEEQQRQRSQAFAFSLAAALGVSVVRWILRRGRGRNAGSAGQRPTTPQPPTPMAQ